MVVIPACTYCYEENAKKDVADVRKDVVEVSEWTKGMSTPKIVEAEVLIPCLIQNLRGKVETTQTFFF